MSGAASCGSALSASMTAVPTSGSAPAGVTFYGSACGGTPPYSWAWTLGDGTTATTQNVSAMYAVAGSYDVSLEVTDAVGAHAWANLTYSVQPSLSVAASSLAGTAPLSATFWGNVSGAQGTVSVLWDFGDGFSGSGSPVAHTFSAVGNYTVSATATESGGSWTGHGELTVHVEGVRSAPPPLTVSLVPAVSEGGAPFPASLTVSASGGSGPYALSLSFGDASSPQTLSGWSGASQTFAHTYASPGIYSVDAVVTDSQGNTASSSAPIFVTGVLALNANASASTHAGTAPLSVTFLAYASEGNPPYTLQWNFGDGTMGSSLVGSPTDHTYTSVGTFSPTLTVTDAAGHVAKVALSPIVVQAAPTPSPSGGFGPGSWWSQASTPIGVIGLVLVFVAVGLLEERRRHRELERQARLLVEAMESAKDEP